MLVAAAVCPSAPLLVPEVAAGAAFELDTLRAACADAIGVLAASRPDRLVVIGPAEHPGRGRHHEGARGSFREFGVDLDVRLGSGPAPAASAEDTGADRPLPPSLAVAAWLLRGWAAAPLEGLGVGESLEQDRCAATGAMIATTADRVALLVMGDGSACRTLKAPGYLDERAEPFDASVGAALAAADTGALAALDTELAQELQAAGRATWQVLAGAAQGAGLAGQLLHEDAPYGVGYFVATWT
ncbi:class III extradiol dioxygenase subunit B-like domain-containing protein [Streptomyces sp. H39-S7]|uniref:class III extradiol dioxygenase subunit B-like domain-containing protein n=1 Tax=Streptomyces sp. H39-S7 TaxID=3004357 RepID=UPI0022AFFC61|nr:class III extradiol dioxygenase subunit B-like domain-containing protein [Streptomyces sp. H39-S7]MCZ4119368.1 class III extradiol dioxygenase subunit B-like domain-containing protein [Streptomyces sp. H39-S7]